MANEKPDAISIIFIASTPDKVWDAICDAALSKSYFFGNTVEVRQEVGAPYIVRRADGTTDVEGKVLVCEKPHRLRVTWRVVAMEELKDKPPAEVEYRIESAGEAVKLSVSEFHTWDVPEKFRESGRNGWALILSGLKSLLETGRPLPPVRMRAPE